MSLFGEHLKELRRSANLSQEELGKIFHVHKTTVSNWEKGNRFPDLDMYVELANYFNVTTDYLIGKTNKRNSKHVTKEELIRFFPEHPWLFDESKSRYVELINKLIKSEISHEMTDDIVQVLVKYYNFNKEK